MIAHNPYDLQNQLYYKECLNKSRSVAVLLTFHVAARRTCASRQVRLLECSEDFAGEEVGCNDHDGDGCYEDVGFEVEPSDDAVYGFNSDRITCILSFLLRLMIM